MANHRKYNAIEIDHEAGVARIEIPGADHPALVDLDDLDAVKNLRWLSVGGYARTRFARTGRGSSEELARWIMSPGAGMRVCHLNHDKLDCRRENLVVTSATEIAAHRPSSWSALGLKGVMLRGPGRYGARVGDRRVGSFATSQEAARAADEARAEMFGSMAFPNLDEDGEVLVGRSAYRRGGSR